MQNDFFAELKSFFQKFPGIGPRQARRFVYSLVDLNEEERKKMGEGILNLSKFLKRCEICFRIFSASPCSFCSPTSRRDRSKIMVVEKDSDLISFEKAGVHNGLYFILGGLFDPLDENQTPKIRIKKLVSQRPFPSELILALPSTKLSDFTCEYIKKSILVNSVKITRLARGLSSGVDLEYADENTLKHAFNNRN